MLRKYVAESRLYANSSAAKNDWSAFGEKVGATAKEIVFEIMCPHDVCSNTV